jgi:excinuclease ABC subunit A
VTSKNDTIDLLDVSTNNLKNIDASFPLGKISVVTGVSGSGKSSLVFDTLYGEAYRRYVESLSSFARQFLKSLPKPKIGKVVNLPSAIAVKQARAQGATRSSVATLTEINDLLRVVFTHLSVNWCDNCECYVERDTPESVARKSFADFDGDKILVCAPLSRWGKMTAKDLKGALEAQGFIRLLVDGEIKKIHDSKAAELKTALVVVDRITLSKDTEKRLVEASQLALKAGRGLCHIYKNKKQHLVFSTTLTCSSCENDFIEPSAALLSYNHPLGACKTCQGFGMEAVLDWDRVVPDVNSNLDNKGVAPWNFGKYATIYKTAKVSAAKHGIKSSKPFSEYTDDDMEWLTKGEKTGFKGINGFFKYLDRKKYRPAFRIHAARFKKYIECTSCGGDRLNKKALSCKILNLNLGEVSKYSIAEFSSWIEEIKSKYACGDLITRATDDGVLGVEEALEEADARLGYLMRIGVGYLSLNRGARTLSGGELQRINMARCLGSSLTDTLFCLDEPTTGLHPRDSEKLLGIVKDLRDQGNTVVLVEHESTIIKGADHLIEIGPKAGHEGGELVYSGKPKAAKSIRKPVSSLTSKKFKMITLKGAATNNLKSVDIEFPVGAITVVCGVSGSGKSSLIQHTLYPALSKTLGQQTEKNTSYNPIYKSIAPAKLINEYSEAMMVSQAALGRSSRSNIATYLGVMDVVRKILSQQPRAKQLKLKPGAFSFNTSGGRCEHCRGLGTVVEDLSFLGEMEVICPECNGRRFGDEVLSVDIRGRNLTNILAMTVSEVRAFFFEIPAVAKVCDIVIDMGLGYVTLGQNTSSFSGGEAQRLKLVSLMKDVKGQKPSILIFDEPSTGLSDKDVENLNRQFRILSDKGHTVIIVEHHLDVIMAADQVIEVGPEAAEGGGSIIFQGLAKDLKGHKGSITAPFLV